MLAIQRHHPALGPPAQLLLHTPQQSAINGAHHLALDPSSPFPYTCSPPARRPVRLVAQDTRLSRGQQGFESPTGRQNGERRAGITA